VDRTVEEFARATGAHSWRIELHHPSLLEAMEAAEISSPLRAAHFLAQIAHESAFFARTEENLNYGSEGLLSTFPRHFPDLETATRYARKPERIANRVYANRMGNGPEESGDGWRYRGMGLIQLTGSRNHDAYWATAVSSGDPAALAGPPHAALSAGWFWRTNGVNSAADLDDVEAVTRKINGGTHGLEARRTLTERAKAALA
jgi:putative chitinase